MAEKIERRRGQLSERVVSGFGIGTPLAGLIAWGLDEFFQIKMPGAVAAMLGAVITSVSVGISAIFVRICPILLLAFKRWMLKK